MHGLYAAATVKGPCAVGVLPKREGEGRTIAHQLDQHNTPNASAMKQDPTKKPRWSGESFELAIAGSATSVNNALLAFDYVGCWGKQSFIVATAELRATGQLKRRVCAKQSPPQAKGLRDRHRMLFVIFS
jgi:hypothetical protein